VIAEALAVGTPVLTSTMTPWRDLESQGLGWDLPLEDPSAFARCLEQLAEMDPDSRVARRAIAQVKARALLAGHEAAEAHALMFMRALEARRGTAIE
jgi:glycosyltransferase involved in cell wall biosynthesis